MSTRPFRAPSMASFFDNLRSSRLRAMFRRGELGLVALAVLIGIAAGLLVALIGGLSTALHVLVFGVERLSSSELSGWIVLTGPVIGGIVLGLILFILSKTRKKPMVDPIEANALHGGRLSLTDSIIVCVQNIVSNGFGASVGLEAGYTQIASGVASKIGIKLKLRRGDMRILVGCGAAGAIAAAFNAPLTGAFYAIELIIGTYTVVTLAPLIVSALVASIVAGLIGGHGLSIDIYDASRVTPPDYVPAIFLGVVCAFIGIVLMQTVSLIEETARKSAIPGWLRPTIGGVAVGALALISPQVLSSGHGALHLNIDADLTIYGLAGLFLLKAAASAISIGSNFRGGLFFCLAVHGVAGRQDFRTLRTLYRLWLDSTRGLRRGRHECFCRRHYRRSSDDDVSGAGTDRRLPDHGFGAGGRHHDIARGTHHLRLLLRHLAFSSAGRKHPQRPRYRLDPRSDGGQDDARRYSQG